MIKKTPRKGHEPWPTFYVFTAILIGLALASGAILDYINQRKGEPSYIFGPREKKTETAPAGKLPEEPSRKPETVPAEKPGKPEPVPKRPAAARTVKGQVALIIDDMGNSLEILDELINLNEPVTVSVLPYSLHAQETARIAHENKLEVLLHLPLESLNNHDAMADNRGMILAGMDSGEIVQAFEDNLARVPFANGVNNHMGSKFTAEGPQMQTLLRPMKDRGLIFVDSRTTAQTVAYDEALMMGIPAVKRDVFLDADADRSLIKSRLLELFQKARKNGRAVGICHPFPETIEILKSSFRLFANYGLEVVPVSRLAQK